MSETSYQHINVRPLAGALGAEIGGVDLNNLEQAQFNEIQGVFQDYGVVFFRQQTLSPESHIAFARRWGDINVNRFFQTVKDFPLIAEVRKEPHQKKNIGGGWHTDHSYDVEPALGSILYALDVPAQGGDTLFASMAVAYDSLSHGMKSLLRGLNAVHSSRHVFGTARYSDAEETAEFEGRLCNAELAVQDAVHPVVIKHPLSGRPCLYVNPGFTLRFEGWTEEESRPLLEYLYEQAQRPEHTCRFRWQQGSVAVWDNRATWHCAVNDYEGQRRLMHRVTLEGSTLEGA